MLQYIDYILLGIQFLGPPAVFFLVFGKMCWSAFSSAYEKRDSGEPYRQELINGSLCLTALIGAPLAFFLIFF